MENRDPIFEAQGIYDEFNKIKMSISDSLQKTRVKKCCLNSVSMILNYIIETDKLEDLKFWNEVKRKIERL